MSNFGILYLVATPIGNLGDISQRAIATLNDVDFIAAEDTRVTIKLLNHFGIKKPLVSYFEHNSRESGEKILARILSGENCALVTDAGMPGISDPGEYLIRSCIGAGIAVTVIPGPCAAVTALVLSGFNSGRFVFEGFLSTSRKSRFEHLESLRNETRTIIFYEAPHKLIRTLRDMLDTFGDRNIAISRELTKIYEETLRFPLSEAVEYFENKSPRGEFVLVLEGANVSLQEKEFDINDAITIAYEHIESGLSVKDSVKTASEKTGVSKNLLYNEIVKK
jgi:16S rRNA (cytidine1402-2'-O)-methyltransferase